MSVLKVTKMGNPVLRKICKPVQKSKIRNKKFQKLIDNMVATMRKEDGAGIAAPQVDVKKRIFVMEMQENPRYPSKNSFSLLVAINPKLRSIGKKKVDSWEGCLSIPAIRGCLKRYATVELKALDRNGKPYTKKLKGFAAVVAQHELDHLDGTLFIDRMKSMETLSFQKEYEAYWM
ncbi:MAG: peptide deformylase [Saprospiraceae bacterium]|jgi:peptide deformylase